MHDKIYEFIIQMCSKSKHALVIFCCFIIFIQIIQIVYFERAFFKESYDVSYWKDRFEHSQWVLPLSKRIIGDDGLFSFIGYDLINGGTLSGYNAETPPLGKYLIGLSILIFKNPAYYAIFFGIGSLFLFYLISKKLLGANMLGLFASAFLFADPLFINQFWKAWVDIAQLFFLLVNIFFFLVFLYNKNNKVFVFSIVSGISLGLFAETKTPILLPSILLLESVCFVYKKKIKEYFVFIFGVFIGILIPYSKFFLDGNSFLDFLRLQKYVVDFYLKSQVVAHKEAIWQTLFLGKFPNISDGSFTSVSEWWIMWPVISGVGIFSSLIFLFKKNVKLIWKGIAFFILSSLVMYTFIPAYPRYLVIILPFFYILFVKAIVSIISKRKATLIFVTILVYGTIHATFFLQPRPEVVLNNFYYNLSNKYFQDIYQENISAYYSPKISREKFRFIGQRALEKATVKAIEVKEIKRNIPTFGNSGSTKISVTYKTERLGSFFEDKNVELLKENGQWKVIWDWDLILIGFLPEYNVVAEESQGRRGRILDSKGEVLAEDSKGYLIAISPEKINFREENIMLNFLSRIGSVKNVHLQNAYLENVLPGSSVSLFTLSTDLSDNLKERIASFSGVRILPHVSRIYKTDEIDPLSIKNVLYEECCTIIYSSNNYHGIYGVEKEYDRVLSGYDGGEIIIRDKKGSIIRNVFSKSKKDGQDVILYD